MARILALLFEGADAREHGHLGRVLEIGTGCGYQAALLARLSHGLVSIERIKPLYDKAWENRRSRRFGMATKEELLRETNFI